jgi:hypothetical protein
MELLPSEKVAILSKAESLFLSPRMVEFVTSPANPDMLNIEYHGVGSAKLYLNVIDNVRQYSLICIPPIKGQKRIITIPAAFEHLLGFIERWFELVKQEVDAEQRYSEILNLDNYVDFEEFSDSEQPFTKDEFETLKQKVQQLHERIDALQIDLDQKEELKREIDTSVRKAEEKGYTKQDFKKHLIGAFITKAIGWALSQDHFRSIWQAMSDLFQFKLELPG